nr:MAG TPA_asm: hypothetical protein [Caudoviricetes sp.]
MLTREVNTGATDLDKSCLTRSDASATVVLIAFRDRAGRLGEEEVHRSAAP